MDAFDNLHSPWIRFGIPILGSMFAAAAVIFLLQSANPLAASCQLATFFMVQAAIVSPRAGIFLLLLLCGYSDMVKRLLVVFGSMSLDQVSNVLMAAPAVVGGLLISIVTRRAFHQTQLRRGDIVFGIVAAVLAGANFLTVMKAGGLFLDAAKAAVNHGVYAAAAMVALRLVENEERLERFMRMAMIVFIPVALYGLAQLYFGFAKFEVDYLRSGLSIELKQLDEIRPRPFSTLNSAGVLGTLCAGFAVLALYPRMAARYRPLRAGESFGSIVVAVIFFAGAVGSLVRASHIVWIVALVGLYCFRTRRGTWMFYGAVVAGFVAILLSADFLLEHLPDFDPAQFGTSGYSQATLTILTYSDRLKGFINLTSSPEMYSLFGLDETKVMTEWTYNHDPISTILIEHGVVGLLIVGMGVVATLVWFHRRLLRMPKGRARTLAVLLVSVLMGWLVSELLVKAVITTFPVNAFFWLFVGALVRLVMLGEARAGEPAVDAPVAPRIPLRSGRIRATPRGNSPGTPVRPR